MIFIFFKKFINLLIFILFIIINLCLLFDFKSLFLFEIIFLIICVNSDNMALVLIRGENNSKILNAIADVERHANLNLVTKPKKIDAKYADKIVENILNAPLRTKSKVAAVFRIREDTATAIVQIKKIHPPAHIIVISNDYEDYNELNKTLNNASVFRGYYSSKKQSTQMKDYKTGKKSN